MRVERSPVGNRATATSDRKTPTVRFLVHGAERSGPPLYLLRLLDQWAMSRPDFLPEVVLARPGPLASEFTRAAPTRIARLDRRSPERIAERALRAARLDRSARRLMTATVRCRVHSSEPALTVVNGATAPTVELLDALDPSGPVVTIAHELSTGWFSNLDRPARELLRSRTIAYLAVSKVVRRFLVERVGIPESAVKVIPPPVDAIAVAPTEIQSSPGRPLVVGMGVTDWRKAPESWLRVAAGVRRHPGFEHVRFAWAGGDPIGARASWPLEHEMDHLDLREHVSFLGSLEDPWHQLGTADVMVSTAREDAFPLACAEAIARGIPVVGFDVDGVGEMVNASGCGTLVPYPDEARMADAVVGLLSDTSLRATMNERGRRWAHRELAVASVATQVEDWIVEQVR